MNIRNSHLILFLIFMFSCQSPDINQDDIVIAEAAGKVLLSSEIINNLPNHQLEIKDSINFVNEYVNKWIKQQLLVAEAEKTLSSEALNIESELEKYRKELLIHKYKNQRLKSIIETEIQDNEIEEYYILNAKNFILDYAIVRVNYIIFPIEVEIPSSFKKRLHSSKEIDKASNEDFIFKYAKKYDDFNNKWIYFENLAQTINYEITDIEKFLKKNNLIEFTTDTELHLISINAYKLSKEQAPLEFVAPQIKSLIINKKKLDFLREIKDSLYNNALKYNKFRVLN